MDKRSIAISGILIFLLIATGFVGFNQFKVDLFNQEVVLGDACFDMPKGFGISENKESSVIINDGSRSIILSVYDDDNIKNHVNEYIKYVEDKNFSTKLSKTTVDDFLVYKVVSNESDNAHYWFNYNNKTYSVSNWAYYDKMDSTVYGLIQSIHPKDSK